MKKFYPLLTIALFSMASIANATNGTVSFQIDQNLGTGEPDLLPAELEEVEATYEDGLLTINQMFYGFDPISFKINLETGETVAIDQIAEEDDNRFYYAIDTKETEVFGVISNVGENKCQLEVQPFGPGKYYPGLGVIIDPVLFNTVFTFDFSIPDLGIEIAEPILEIGSVTYETINSEYGIYLQFTVEVTSENLPEGSEISVYYKGPYDNDFKVADENADGTYGFPIAGVQEDEKFSVEVFAEAGTVVSELKTLSFTLESGVSSIIEDGSQSRYFNLKGEQVKNPKEGEIYIKVNNGVAKKVLII